MMITSGFAPNQNPGRTASPNAALLSTPHINPERNVTIPIYPVQVVTQEKSVTQKKHDKQTKKQLIILSIKKIIHNSPNYVSGTMCER